MDGKTQELLVEREYLDKTKTAMAAEIERLENIKAATKKQIKDLQKYFVTETEIFGSIDEVEIVDATVNMNAGINYYEDTSEKAEKLKRTLSRPYFGRVDFTPEKEDNFQIYIGLSSVENAGNYYVYDWRAPICQLFYDYGKGKAKYASPVGTVNGEITLKRQYEIENGELIDFYDLGKDIFDEYLQKVLSQINNEKLHNIASTIQTEQNEIIRNLSDNVVIVQGYAGSGKTTVALHRIAYQLYRLKDLKSANILLFTLNEAFMTHINGVLPELGEENTRSTTLAKFTSMILQYEVRVEENDEFLERYLRSNLQAKTELTQKLALKSKDDIARFIADFTKTRHATKGFKVRDISFQASKLNALFTQNFGELKLYDRLEAIVAHVCDQIKVPQNSVYCDEVRNRVYEYLEVPKDVKKLYTFFCEAHGYTEPTAPILRQEDVVLICLLKESASEIEPDIDIKHIVIDEAQEYPLLFIDFLMRVFKNVNFSIFGDRYQRTNPAGIDDLNKIANLNVVHGSTKLYNLDNTYRSSEEIVTFASNIINNPRHNAFRLSNSEPVTVKNLTDITSEINALLANLLKGNGTIGVITGDLDSAKNIFKAVSKTYGHQACLIENTKSAAAAQIEILPVSLCKGLEFNTVIVVKNGELFQSELGTNLYFIACTRAINKLIVLEKKEK